MGKVFVFCIGGTGLRVMKSITMLAASGMKTNGYSIVPIIVDPHIDLEEKTNLTTLIGDYIKVYNNTTINDNPLTGFFNTRFQRLEDLDQRQNGITTSMSERRSFGEYLNVGNLSNKDVNNFLIQSLFSSDNLKNSLSVGFKGNPNIGTVVLNEMVKGSDWFEAFRRHCEKDDRVFIVSSIFGGTGASGYPLIEKMIRESEGYPTVQKVLMGAVTVLPYYSLKDPTTTGSDIDSTSFYTKTKAALSYYENTVKSDYLYYVGEQSLRTSYDNNEKEQKDTAHFVELVAASALFDFLYKEKPETPQALSRAIRENEDKLDLSSLGEGYKDIVKRISNMMLLYLLIKILPDEHYFPLIKDRQFNSDFYHDQSFVSLQEFANKFYNWYLELSNNDRGFAPLNIVGAGGNLTSWIKGISSKAKDESYYLLEMIKASNKEKSEHSNKLRYLLEFADEAINVYTKGF